MELHLKYEPTPGNAAQFAADIVATARSVDGVELDYAPASLAAVDAIIERFRGEGMTAAQVGETVFGFGCYVGEVFVHNAGGTWRAAAATPMRPFTGSPFVVELGPDHYCDPVAKVYKRLENGPEESLPYFYDVFTKPPPSASDQTPSASPPSAPPNRRWWQRG